MKATAVFPQSNHLPAQHGQSIIPPNSSAFNQQLQQHLLPAQQQQHQQSQQHRGQHVQQLHRLSQSNVASIHNAQPVVSAGGTLQANNVFPTADFFHTLQQTAAAAALPTVLPYDQSQYIGQLMYFPYPAAATNGLFGATQTMDSSQQQHHHHMTATICSPNRQSASGIQPTGNLVDQSNVPTSVNNGGVARLMPAVTSGAAGMLAAGQLISANHLQSAAAGVSTTTASLSPLFTTAQFYHQQQQQQATISAGQQHIQQLHHQQQQHTLQHHLQSVPLPQSQQHSLAVTQQHMIQQRQQPSATLLLSSPLQPTSTSPAVAAVASTPSNSAPTTMVVMSQPHVSHQQQSVSTNAHHHITSSGLSEVNETMINVINGLNKSGGSNSSSNHCRVDEEDAVDESSQQPIHSTPNHTPVKQAMKLIDDAVQNNDNSMNRIGNNSSVSSNHTTNNPMEVNTASIKRDNTGTGHFVCNVCGREFGMRCRLIAHTRRHTGERPFPCADCGRAFSDRGNLQRHRYTHSNQPRFHCSVCGKLFRQASCLSNHRRFHCAGATGRPCPFCQRSFRSSSSLQMHIRWKHRADAAAAVAAAAAASSAGGGPVRLADLSSPGHNTARSVTANFNPAGIQQHHHLLQSYPNAVISYTDSTQINGAMDSCDILRVAAAVAASASSCSGVTNSCTTTSTMTSTCGGQICLPVHQSAGLPPGLLLDQLNFPYDVTMLGGGSAPVATNASASSKRKWRRKSKPKQQAQANSFGKLTGDGLNLLAGFQLTDGTGLCAMGSSIDMNAMTTGIAASGPVPLDRKGRPCNFSCPACPRRFAFQCRLAAHIRCHTNIRPFICIDCGRAFTQRGYLVRHAAVHKLDRPFSCALCDRSYKHYGSLVNHRRTHGKSSGINLNGMSLLTGVGGAHLTQCDPNVSGVGTISCLEEVVGGSLISTSMTEKDDENDLITNGGSAMSGRPTITLLPVTKVEELLPGDIAGARLISCTTIGNGSITDNQLRSEGSVHATNGVVSSTSAVVNQSQTVAIPPISSLPHQLTATAVWPILAGAGVGQAVGPAAHLFGQNVPHSMVTASNFPALTLSNHFGQIAVGSSTPGAAVVNSQPHYLQAAQRAPPHLTQQQATSILSGNSTAIGGTPTYVTVPLFSGGGSQQVTTAGVDSTTAGVVPSVVVSTSAHQHSFHSGLVSGTVASSGISSGLSTTSQHLHLSNQTMGALNQQQSSVLSSQLGQLSQSVAPGGDVSGSGGSSAPVLHVLQPSPSIFFSPYYLPHTATSQM